MITYENEQYLNTREAANYVGLSIPTLYNYVVSGVLTSHRIPGMNKGKGQGKVVYFKLHDLDAYKNRTMPVHVNETVFVRSGIGNLAGRVNPNIERVSQLFEHISDKAAESIKALGIVGGAMAGAGIEPEMISEALAKVPDIVVDVPPDGTMTDEQYADAAIQSLAPDIPPDMRTILKNAAISLVPHIASHLPKQLQGSTL